MSFSLLGIVHHHDLRHLITLVIRQLFFQFFDLFFKGFDFLGIILLNKGLQAAVLFLSKFLKGSG